jgi:hypothetical protein
MVSQVPASTGRSLSMLSAELGWQHILNSIDYKNKYSITNTQDIILLSGWYLDFKGNENRVSRLCVSLPLFNKLIRKSDMHPGVCYREG